jgi:hypothetical protein
MFKNVLNEVQVRRVTGMCACVRAGGLRLCARIWLPTPFPLARFVSLVKLFCRFEACVVFGICREGLEIFKNQYHPSTVTDLRYLQSGYVAAVFL